MSYYPCQILTDNLDELGFYYVGRIMNFGGQDYKVASANNFPCENAKGYYRIELVFEKVDIDRYTQELIKQHEESIKLLKLDAQHHQLMIDQIEDAISSHKYKIDELKGNINV